MNKSVRKVSRKLFYTCQRVLNVDTKCKVKQQWVVPTGYKTDINVYNPVTKGLTPLILKNKDILTWYSCGPTVYDSAHIGHAVTYVKSDIIRRILIEFFNINVVMAMCITDIDDKIIQRSREQGKTIQELTKYYEDEFFDDMKALNVMQPNLYCRVSDHIPEIIKFIQMILDKDMAYVSKDGSVYFDTSKLESYDEVVESPTSVPNPNKKLATDFSLWKAAKEGEPSWESAWGPGRPGWHIECSTIASMIFGNTLDIHTGGIDLAFPHHKNEETQSCCYHNVDQWVNYWIRFGHLFLRGDVKMSKSLKNTVNIQEFLEKYTANQFRMLCLLSDYRSGIEFSMEIMDKAVATMSTIENFIGDCDNYIKGKHEFGNIDESSLLQCLNETKDAVSTLLANDFNTAETMHSIIKLVKVGNKMLNEKDVSPQTRNVTAIAAVSDFVSNTMSKFGISKSVAADDDKINKIIDEFVKFRKVVRLRALEGNKDKALLSACDNIRCALQSHGVTLKDTKDNTTWTRQKY